MTRSVQPASSIAAAVRAATASPGPDPGSWGAFLISTFTTIPSQTASDLREAGTYVGRLAHAQSPITPRPGISASWWTARPRRRQAHVSSTPSAPSRWASANASSVFDKPAGRP